LFDDGSADRTEAEMQNAHDGHRLKIIVERYDNKGESSMPSRGNADEL
jgi:hypothetical protein